MMPRCSEVVEWWHVALRSNDQQKLSVQPQDQEATMPSRRRSRFHLHRATLRTPHDNQQT